MNEQCVCDSNNTAYKIIENYRSIVNRKQPFICSWKVFHQDGKINFNYGTKYRKNSDALAIRSSYYCLINPWYKYIDIHEYFRSIIKHKSKYNLVFEIILLECSCSTHSYEYELAIIQCPCLEQLKTYCTYCHFILRETENLKLICFRDSLNNISQQTDISFSSGVFHSDICFKDYIATELGPSQHQRSVQIQIESKEILDVIKKYDINTLVVLTDDNIEPYSVEPNVKKQHTLGNSISLPCLAEEHFSKLFYSKASLSIPDSVDSNENMLYNKNTFEALKTYRTRATQTKLFAVLLPFSPLSEMNDAHIEAKTLANVTRICQVNTLSYLVKNNDNQIEKSDSLKNSLNRQKMNRTSSIILVENESQLNQELLSKEKNTANETRPTIVKYQTSIDRQFDLKPDTSINDFNEQKIKSSPSNHKVQIIFNEERSEESILMPSTLKFINPCDVIDFDDSNITMISELNNTMDLTYKSSNARNKNNNQLIDVLNIKHHDPKLQLCNRSLNNNNIHTINNHSNEQNICLQRNHSSASLYHLPVNHDETTLPQRRRNSTRKQISNFRQFFHHKKQPDISSANFDKNQSSSNSSSCTKTTNNTSLNRQEEYFTDLNSSNSNITNQYKLNDHIIIARASKHSTACQQLQTLLKNPDTSVEHLIDSQLLLTINNDYKSLCILIDDNKESQQYRSSFLRHIYTNLANSLTNILKNTDIKLTCMNLVFFNNSLCDIINMTRLRLIDTGRNILLLPSCEISLRTIEDIRTATRRLSINMPYAHQIFIVNFCNERLSVSGSFLFLQLAPICSLQSKGLLTNLNSTTYSVLKLIRQLSTGQLFEHNKAKRYLLNDYVLNRLLKSYLFSLKQTTTVLTLKSKMQ